MSGWAWLAVASALAASANLCLRRGARAMGHDRSLLKLPKRILHAPYALLGLALYVLAMEGWLMVLRTQPLVVAYPVFVGVTFGLVLAASSLTLREKVSLRTLAGALLVVGGIVLAV